MIGLDEDAFENWMTAFATRAGKPLDPTASAAYYTALSAEMDTDTFCRAAQHVFTRHAYPTWPAPIEFISAAAGLRHRPSPEIAPTLASIDAMRALPAPGTDALAQFGVTWRETLRDCDPEAPARERRKRLFAAAQGPTPPCPWRTDDSPPRLLLAAPTRTPREDAAPDTPPLEGPPVWD